MSDPLLMLRLASNLGLAAVMLASIFVALAHFVEDRKPRHIVGATTCFVLMVLFLLRTTSTTNPPLIDQRSVMFYVAILWAVTLLLLVTWIALLAIERWRVALASRRLFDTQNGGTE